MSRLGRDPMRVLIADIVGGTLPTGATLPREVDLATGFEISRGVARECVRGLEQRGLVRIRHGIGATVSESERWDVLDPDVLSALVESDHGAEILEEYFECRRILETGAAGVAADRATEADLRALSNAFARISASAELMGSDPTAGDLGRAADAEFQRALVAATGNRTLGNMVEPVRRALERRSRPRASPDQLERTLEEYRRLLAAIARRAPEEARAAMSAHLDTVESSLREDEGSDDGD